MWPPVATLCGHFSFDLRIANFQFDGKIRVIYVPKYTGGKENATFSLSKKIPAHSQ